MKISDLHHVEHCVERFFRIEQLIKELNAINGSDQPWSLPIDVLNFVDSKDAAKGLLSLLIESSKKYKDELERLGMSFD